MSPSGLVTSGAILAQLHWAWIRVILNVSIWTLLKKCWVNWAHLTSANLKPRHLLKQLRRSGNNLVRTGLVFFFFFFTFESSIINYVNIYPIKSKYSLSSLFFELFFLITCNFYCSKKQKKKKRYLNL